MPTWWVGYDFSHVYSLWISWRGMRLSHAFIFHMLKSEIPESSRLEFLEKFFANNFALSYAEGNTSRPLNSRGVADLPLLWTLVAIHQMSRQPSFWEVMYSCVLLAHVCLAASGTLLQRLLACLNFSLESEDLSFWYKWKKVISMNCGSSTSSWRDMYEGYIHQFQPKPTHKIY